jgi:hypothetical protein
MKRMIVIIIAVTIATAFICRWTMKSTKDEHHDFCAVKLTALSIELRDLLYHESESNMSAEEAWCPVSKKPYLVLGNMESGFIVMDCESHYGYRNILMLTNAGKGYSLLKMEEDGVGEFMTREAERAGGSWEYIDSLVGKGKQNMDKW